MVSPELAALGTSEEDFEVAVGVALSDPRLFEPESISLPEEFVEFALLPGKLPGLVNVCSVVGSQFIFPSFATGCHCVLTPLSSS